MHDHDHDQWHTYGPSTGKTEADKSEPWSSLGLSQVKQPGLPHRDHQVRRSTVEPPPPPQQQQHPSKEAEGLMKMAVDYAGLDGVVWLDGIVFLYPAKLLSSSE